MTESKWEEDEHGGLTREQVDKQIACSLEQQIRTLIETCLEEKPAEITRVQFGNTHASFQLRWPFWVPPPSGDAGDWLGTPRAVQEFRKGFKKHLQKQNAGARLSNLLQAEFIEFMLRHLGLYRFSEDIIKRLRKPGERRLGGRPRRQLEKTLKIRIQKEGPAILKTILEMKRKIRTWKKEKKELDDKTMRVRLLEEYDRERHPWMRVFSSCVRDLPMSRNWSGRPSLSVSTGFNPQNPQLSDPQSWSASGLTSLILQKMLYRETGLRYGLGGIRKLVHMSMKQR